MKAISLAVAMLAVSGCASTNIVGYADPVHQSDRYSSLAVYARGMSMERAAQVERGICSELSGKGVQCLSFVARFPPTRNYTVDQVFSSLQGAGVDSLAILSPGGDASSVSTFAYQSAGSATMVGSQAYGYGTTVPVSSYSRRAYTRITLVDVGSRENAWVGDAKTEGSGLLNVTDDAFTSSLTTEVSSALLNTPMFARGD